MDAPTTLPPPTTDSRSEWAIPLGFLAFLFAFVCLVGGRMDVPRAIGHASYAYTIDDFKDGGNGRFVMEFHDPATGARERQTLSDVALEEAGCATSRRAPAAKFLQDLQPWVGRSLHLERTTYQNKRGIVSFRPSLVDDIEPLLCAQAQR